LAVDVGASSGRLILGKRNDTGTLDIEEVHRFANRSVMRGSRQCWDLDRILEEILVGMRKCAHRGIVPVSVGIDAWGVDFVLLDAEGRVIGDSVSYRDTRTQFAPADVHSCVSESVLYARTGIQQQSINTIYQLWTVREQLDKADAILMVPDYLHYLLTGVMANEYTEASTTGLLNVTTRTWDRELLDDLGYPQHPFTALRMPGDKLGNLKPQIADRVGFQCLVVLPATHDTSSAVVAAPLKDDSIYVSSGTWSLLGVENTVPITSEASRLRNLTNEGGAQGRYCFLKNIAGLWMVQETRRELGSTHSFGDLNLLAEDEPDFVSTVDVTDPRFLSPVSMTEAIRQACMETGQRVPDTPGKLVRCILQSLAKSYSQTIEELVEVTGRSFGGVCIVGGGSKNGLLNRLTAEESGLDMTVGPAEATALGNVALQMIADGAVEDIEAARTLIASSSL